jgi:hypothetical protein
MLGAALSGRRGSVSKQVGQVRDYSDALADTIRAFCGAAPA